MLTFFFIDIRVETYEFLLESGSGFGSLPSDDNILPYIDVLNIRNRYIINVIFVHLNLTVKFSTLKYKKSCLGITPKVSF